jgi:8-amino-3,8-dideoxy-alpha-D-manno-octulosonate transaminase
MTNNKEVFEKCDGYTDHGHDHKGVDRGADLHPFIGYNFRISELHSAIGLAQIRKLQTFLQVQKKNYKILKEILSQLPEVSFRVVPDETGNSCTFLSWFLPSEEMVKAVMAELKVQNIAAGNFYWFDNNWHYIRKWHHLKNATTLNPLSEVQRNALLSLNEANFPVSDSIMSRCISTSISLLWSEEQVREKGERIKAVIEKVLQSQTISV